MIDLPLTAGGFPYLAVDAYAFFIVGPADPLPPAILTRGQERIRRPLRLWPSEPGSELTGFLVGPVPPGTWRIRWDEPKARWSAEVEVRATEVTRVPRDDLQRTPQPPAGSK